MRPQCDPNATPMRPQCDSNATPKPPLDECRMQNVECRKPPKARYKPGTCEVQARCKPGECGPRAWWLARTSAATLNGGVRSLSKLAFLRGMVQDCGIVKRRREPASVIRGH